MENFAKFLFLFNQETRRLIRNIENIKKKLINYLLAVVFKEACLNEDILPIYTNIYIYVQILNTYIYMCKVIISTSSCLLLL